MSTDKRPSGHSCHSLHSCESCVYVRYDARCTILPRAGQPCEHWESPLGGAIDPLTEILRLGASAEVAAAWMALAEWAATAKRPATPQEAALLRAYYEATGAHERNVEALEELLQEPCDAP